MKVWVRQTVTYGAILVMVVLVGFPFYWMVVTSLKGPTEIFAPVPRFWPESPTLQNYRHVLTATPFPRYLMNSLVVSTATMAISVLIAVHAGYALSRFRFRGHRVIQISILLAQMFPPVLLIIPLFNMMKSLHLVNTYPSLVITYCAVALPFSIWMLKGYFDSIPVQLEEAALVDGCTRLQALFRVVIPAATPGIAATALFAFIIAWQEYLFALTLTKSATMRTLTVGISMFLGFREVLWGQLMAAAVMVTLPVVVFFMYLQKYLVHGLTMGSVKG